MTSSIYSHKGITRIAGVLWIIISFCSCERQSATRQEMNLEALPKERSLPDGTFYKSQFKTYFPEERLPDSDSSNIYVCGAVRKPQTITPDRDITLGSAI